MTKNTDPFVGHGYYYPQKARNFVVTATNDDAEIKKTSAGAGNANKNQRVGE